MGILNVTPNSFYDGGKHSNVSEIIQHVGKMLADGADFIDVGAYSSKPGAEFVSENEELERIVPIVEAVLKEFPDTLISIDTFRAKVAKVCVGIGASIINDISAGMLDKEMIPTVGRLKVPYIMMHMRGTPNTMQSLTEYDDIVREMLFYFSERIAVAREAGINDIIIDPGFGFAKTLEQNYEVFAKAELFQMLELPVLVGVSRKSMVYKSLGISADEALNGTTVLNSLALVKGAHILRVHDVKEAVEAVRLFGKTR